MPKDCVFGCGQLISYPLMEYHCISSCPNSTFQCSNCSQEFKLNQMSEDEQKQAFQHDCMSYFRLSIQKLKQTQKSLEKINKEKEEALKTNSDLIKSQAELSAQISKAK